MNEKITIIAGKVPFFYYKRKIKIFFEPFLSKYFNYKPSKGELMMYGGHYAVSRSLMEGLYKMGYTNFNYNPSSITEVGDVVLVIADIYALKQAIKWKKQGRIKKLIAGPNLCILPTEYPEISSEWIDRYITHSQWCVDYFVDLCPCLKNKMEIWPAGVDEVFWSPNKEVERNGKKIVFFKKRPEKTLYEKCYKIAQENGFEVIELIRGGYTLDEYNLILAKADFLVHFVEQESQGISLSEAWSMNVPTMVWNPGYWHYQLMNIKSSSAPLMNDKMGKFFRDENEFEELFKKQFFDSSLYSARENLINNYTDTKSAEIFLNIVKSIENDKQG